jgi:hypothetical protein
MKKTFLIATLAFPGYCYAWPVHEQAAYTKKEQLNKHLFVYQEESINGVTTKSWFIDGKPVEQEAYLDAILEAEKEERRVERLAQDQQREKENQLKTESFVAGARRMLSLKVEQIDVILRRIEQYHLEPYLVFDATTFATRADYEQVTKELIPDIKKVLHLSAHECAPEELALLRDRLEHLPAKLQELLYATTQQAIAQCTDTRLLKELLELVV